ncbi:MAG: ZIP family metal transporter [Gemmatimonadetes bacterium]|nr:ZIP family metal transporter [Gemmatimonadota bacterium]
MLCSKADAPLPCRGGFLLTFANRFSTFRALQPHSPRPPEPVNIAFLYALAAAGANLAGGLLITVAAPGNRAAQRLLIGFGAGYMLALVFLAMVPHALRGGYDAAIGVLGGYLLVHLTQHVVTPHFHFGEETHSPAMVGRWVGISALAGLLLHAFFDGVAIASGFSVSAALGFLVFTGILLHKIPEGVTLASIMLASGNTRRAAILGVLLLGAATVAGVGLTGYLEPLQRHGLAVSAGVTLYVAASNLLPEVQQEQGWGMPLAIFSGVALFYVGRLFLGQLHT